jgi:hypothetical protein
VGATENVEPQIRGERQLTLPDRQFVRTSRRQLSWFGETDEGAPSTSIEQLQWLDLFLHAYSLADKRG